MVAVRQVAGSSVGLPNWPPDQRGQPGSRLDVGGADGLAFTLLPRCESPPAKVAARSTPQWSRSSVTGLARFHSSRLSEMAIIFSWIRFSLAHLAALVFQRLKLINSRAECVCVTSVTTYQMAANSYKATNARD